MVRPGKKEDCESIRIILLWMEIVKIQNHISHYTTSIHAFSALQIFVKVCFISFSLSYTRRITPL